MVTRWMVGVFWGKLGGQQAPEAPPTCSLYWPGCQGLAAIAASGQVSVSQRRTDVRPPTRLLFHRSVSGQGIASHHEADATWHGREDGGAETAETQSATCRYTAGDPDGDGSRRHFQSSPFFPCSNSLGSFARVALSGLR